VKPREVRRGEARYWGIGMLVAVSGLLFLYVLVEGAPTPQILPVAPLVTAAATLSGVYIGSRLTERQRREGDRQRRRVLATMFLSELRSLERALREACQQSPETRSITVARTPTFDQAGAHLLLFSLDTAQALITFYQQVPKVQALAHGFRANPQLQGSGHTQLWQSSIDALKALREAATRLHRDEQGEWPRDVSSAVDPGRHGSVAWFELPPSVF
jgi:hypothetical protein